MIGSVRYPPTLAAAAMVCWRACTLVDRAIISVMWPVTAFNTWRSTSGWLAAS